MYWGEICACGSIRATAWTRSRAEQLHDDKPQASLASNAASRWTTNFAIFSQDVVVVVVVDGFGVMIKPRAASASLSLGRLKRTQWSHADARNERRPASGRRLARHLVTPRAQDVPLWPTAGTQWAASIDRRHSNLAVEFFCVHQKFWASVHYAAALQLMCRRDYEDGGIRVRDGDCSASLSLRIFSSSVWQHAVSCPGF